MISSPCNSEGGALDERSANMASSDAEEWGNTERSQSIVELEARWQNEWGDKISAYRNMAARPGPAGIYCISKARRQPYSLGGNLKCTAPLLHWAS
jgi:hypothetical protein